MAPVEQASPWFEKKSLVGLLLVLFFPLGLWGLWKSSSLSKPAKIVISSIVGLVLIIAANGSPEDSPNNVVSGQPTVDEVSEENPGESPLEPKGSLADLERLKMGSDEWNQLHEVLVAEADNPHPMGVKFEKGPDTDIREELWSVQVGEFASWLSSHPVAEVVQSVHLERDTVCGDWQVVLVCRETPNLTPLTKCAFMLRLNHDWNDDRMLQCSADLAVAVDGIIVERWTGDDRHAFSFQHYGEMPAMPRLSEEDGPTMAERQKLYDAHNQEVAEWSERFNAFWNQVKQEAGLPVEDK